MTLISWILRILLIVFILRLVLRALFPQRTATRGRATRKPLERAGGALVQDPQCGTYVPKSRALVSGNGEHAKYFCSAECRDRYLSSGARRHAS
jgi:YHS domain-containing protein